METKGLFDEEDFTHKEINVLQIKLQEFLTIERSLEEVKKFYYDNKLIRQVDDVEIMAQINNTTMNVILNNSLSKPDNDTNSDFVVKYFKFSPL